MKINIFLVIKVCFRKKLCFKKTFLKRKKKVIKVPLSKITSREVFSETFASTYNPF